MQIWSGNETISSRTWDLCISVFLSLYLHNVLLHIWTKLIFIASPFHVLTDPFICNEKILLVSLKSIYRKAKYPILCSLRAISLEVIDSSFPEYMYHHHLVVIDLRMGQLLLHSLDGIHTCKNEIYLFIKQYLHGRAVYTVFFCYSWRWIYCINVLIKMLIRHVDI